MKRKISELNIPNEEDALMSLCDNLISMIEKVVEQVDKVINYEFKTNHLHK